MDTSLLEALKDPLLSAFDQLPAHVQLTSAQVALLLQVSKRALEEWRVRGEPPPWVELSPRTIRYPAGALKGWLDERLAYAPKSTSESQKKKKAALEGLDEPVLSAGRKRSRHDTFRAYLAEGLPQDEWPFALLGEGQRPVNFLETLGADIGEAECLWLSLDEYLTRLRKASLFESSQAEHANLDRELPEADQAHIPKPI